MKNTISKVFFSMWLVLPGLVMALPTSPLYLGAYGGYGASSGAYNEDGQFAQGRLALGFTTPVKNVGLGAEIGIQSGNTMRLNASSSLLNSTGGLPIQVTLKPLVDLLGAVDFMPSNTVPVHLIFKGGIAYRQLTLDYRTSASDSLRKVNFEAQVGLGYNLSNNFVISGFYQGIYSGGSADLGTNSVGDVTLGRIPTQQAGFLGIEYLL